MKGLHAVGAQERTLYMLSCHTMYPCHQWLNVECCSSIATFIDESEPRKVQMTMLLEPIQEVQPTLLENRESPC